MVRKPKFREFRLLRAAWPLIVAEAAYSIIYLTDTAMIARLGEERLAALGPSLAVFWVITIFGVGYLATVNMLVAQSLAKGRYRQCGIYAWQGIWTGVVIGVGTFTLLSPLAPWMFSLFGHAPAVYSHEVPYFQISLISVAPEMGAITLSAYFVAIGKIKVPMIGALIAMASNFLFNYALIWGNVGFPEMGMPGSAWSTVIASTLHFLFLFSIFLGSRDRRLGTRNFLPSWSRFLTLGELGIPAGLQAAVEFLSWGVIVIAFVGVFGTPHLAAGTILISISQAAYLPADGISSYVLAQAADAAGRKKFRLARIRATHAIRLVLSYLSLVAILIVLFRSPMMNAFSDNQEVVSIGEKAMVIVAIILVVDAVGIVLLHCLQGVGDIVWTASASILSAMLVFVGGGLAVVFFVPEWGSLGIWGVAALYIATQSTLYTIRWRSGRWTESILS